MKYHISIHISPYEIDNYQLFIHQLKRNLNYLDHDIIFNPCLNLSNYFYDWENSILNSEFFTHKFNELNKIVENKVILNSVINFEDKILGALDYKRDFLQKYKNEVDAFIWFDSDMIFPDDTLFYLINSFEEVNHNKCIITPQITRLWDTSWDILVNEQYLNRSLSFETYADFDGYDLYTPTGDKTLIENPIYTKFASGWCNLLSSTLFKEYIEYPKRLGHYGKDDTFAMFVLDMYKKKGHDIKQFIIQNLIVTENNKFKISSYDDLVTKNINVKSKEIFRQESEDGMNYELNQLYNKINKL
jgi:hypothetical protein